MGAHHVFHPDLPSNISNWIWYGRSGVSACTDVVGSTNVISDDVYFHTAAYMLAQYIVVMTSFGATLLGDGRFRFQIRLAYSCSYFILCSSLFC